ncbi:hypothetical protein [Alloalcanivorax mobilis]|uniref:hypothetical protein n=1 Tax=Alloalcanivorax mobilis TaxID=2019569 RepID=UPI0018E48ED4|nr:hypothetical protein [Alloalcanivorax mobilis]
MSVWQQWLGYFSGERCRREKRLLIELALMLLMALVVGVYFLEHFSSRLEAQQREQLQALAHQTALRATESLASDDLIGLNVIARETQAMAPVASVRFLNTARETVTGSEPEPGLVSVEVPVALPDGELAGSVVLAAPAPLKPRQHLEAGFLLVVVGLLLLRVAAELIRRRLQRAPPAPAVPAGEEAAAPAFRRVAEAPVAPPAPVTELRLSVVNFDHFEQRYTRGALQALLADYRDLLSQVATLYGGEVVAQVGGRARVRFSAEPLSASAFSALCAGLLFLRVARLQGPRRKSNRAPALEFKALISSQFDDTESWALCVAGVPGRLHVPDTELTRAELDVKALYQSERALVVASGERQVRLQPVEQLAHRYQTLLRTQAERVMGAGDSGEGETGEGDNGDGDNGEEGTSSPSR